jgi:hypothetical protein
MKLQLKRSNVLEGGFAKEPTTAQMEYGELAVNYNLDDPCIFIKDSGNNIIRISNAGVPITGDINLQPGTLDDRYVMLAGSTMTGPLILNADPTDDLGAATKQYVDSIDIPAAPDTGAAPPSNPEDGQLWWNSDDGRLYIYYTDVDSSQWVPATPETETEIEVNPDGGLENINGAAQIKIRAGYGVSTSSLGLQIGDDWSNIPTLPEV